jgi:hypothetical protein
MRIKDLILEATRRCSMQCGHCLRGDARPEDGQMRHVIELLEGVTEINNITFTGGEPFLNVQFIEQVLWHCRKERIPVNTFYIATNGVVFNKDNLYSQRCMKVMLDWYLYCEDREYCSVQLSKTEWHQQWEDVFIAEDMLSAFRFFSTRGEDLEQSALIPEGRGADWCTRRNPLKVSEPDFDYPGDALVYLNVEGRVMWGCDYSYDTQDEDAVSIKEAREIIQKLNDLEDSEGELDPIAALGGDI